MNFLQNPNCLQFQYLKSSLAFSSSSLQQQVQWMLRKAQDLQVKLAQRDINLCLFSHWDTYFIGIPGYKIAKNMLFFSNDTI